MCQKDAPTSIYAVQVLSHPNGEYNKPFFQHFHPSIPVRKRNPVAGTTGRRGSHNQDIFVKIGFLKIYPGTFAGTTLTIKFVARPYSPVFSQGL